MRVILFDICGTIYRSNTTFDFLDFLFSENKSFQLFRRIYHSLCWKAINSVLRQVFDIDLTRILALKYLKGYRREELVGKVETFYDEYLVSRKNQTIVAAVENARTDENTRAIILSATIDVVAEVIARRLNCQEYYSTQLEYKRGLCTGKIKKDLFEKKLGVVKGLGVDGPVSSFYTDDFADAPVLELAAKKYIVVYPKYKRQWIKISEKRGWDVRFIEV